MVEPHVFRRYDIRGRAGDQISESLAWGVGRALGARIHAAGGRDAAVGRDVRHSSPVLSGRVAAGLRDAGLQVRDLGTVPTPVLYHAVHRLGLGGGVMVTASHNPAGDNGFKLCLGSEPFDGDGIQELRVVIEAGERDPSGLAPRTGGTITPLDYLPDYLDELSRRFEGLGALRVAVDCGNGVMGPVVVPLLRRLGVDVAPLYCEPDGDFPNHVPDPEVPAYMQDLGRLVVERGAQLGLGFDGDGDRLGLLDERGRKLSADWLLALFAREVLVHHPGGVVRYDAKCSDFLERDVRAHGGVPVMGETGHSLLKRDVARLDAVLGGELSGHIVFNRGYLPIDDALYAALVLLELVARRGVPVSTLFADFPELVSTAEIKLACAEQAKFAVVDALARQLSAEHDVATVDGVRVRLAQDTWFLVRASNTSPFLTVRLEAPTVEAFRGVGRLLLDALASHESVDRSPLAAALE